MYSKIDETKLCAHGNRHLLTTGDVLRFIALADRRIEDKTRRTVLTVNSMVQFIALNILILGMFNIFTSRKGSLSIHK